MDFVDVTSDAAFRNNPLITCLSDGRQMIGKDDVRVIDFLMSQSTWPNELQRPTQTESPSSPQSAEGQETTT